MELSPTDKHKVDGKLMETMLNRMSRLQRLSMLCLLSISLFVFSPAGALGEESIYYVQGKTVNKNGYRAALLVNDAIKLIQKQSYERAAGKLKMAIVLSPELAVSYTYLGIICARQNKNAEALKYLTKATQCPDAPATCFASLATFHQTNGDLDASISVYRTAKNKLDDSQQAEEIDTIIKLLERERERRQESSGSSAGSKSTDDYLQDALESGFHRWSDSRMPLKVYIEPVEKLDGYEERYDVYLRESFFDWSKALDKKVTFVFVDDPNKANISCHWTDDPEKLGNGTENGETRIRMAGQNIVTGSIYLRAKEKDGGFPMSDQLVITTCLHEIGHALGLSGHSPNPKDVMFFSVPLADVERKITARDKNTMMKIYSREKSIQSLLLDFVINPMNAALLGLVTLVLGIFLLIFIKTRKAKPKKRRKG